MDLSSLSPLGYPASALIGGLLSAAVARRNKQSEERVAASGASATVRVAELTDDAKLRDQLLTRLAQVEGRLASTEGQVATWQERYWTDIAAVRAENVELKAKLEAVSAQNARQATQIAEQATQIEHLEALVGELKSAQFEVRRKA